MEQIIQIISKYGLEAVILALFVNVFTGIVKIPIKLGAKKLKESSKVTRLIVFLPILLGFLLSFLYAKFVRENYVLDAKFIRLWLTSSSLSLTFYAIFEKLFPCKEKDLNEEELKTAADVLQTLKKIVEPIYSQEETRAGTMQGEGQVQTEKIILKGKGQ